MRAYVVLEKLDERLRPHAVFFSQEAAEFYAARLGDDTAIHEFIIEGDYTNGHSLFTCFTLNPFSNTYRLEGLYASENEARACAGEDGKVTVMAPMVESDLEQDGWIEP